MHHDIAVVHQHPTAVGCTLYREGQLAVFFFDLFADVISQRAQLAVTVTVTNDKIIRDDRIRSQIEKDNVFGLFIFNGVDDKAGEINRFQSKTPCSVGHQ